MSLPTRLPCAVLALMVLAGCGPVSATAPPTAVSTAAHPAASGTAAERPAVRALKLLRQWDARRAHAYSTGDLRALRRLYAPGSLAGARDVRVLREYVARGLVVDGLVMQLVEARVVSVRPGMVRVRVVDTVAGGRVHRVAGPHRGADLPTGRPVTRVVTLVHGVDGWVVRAVRRP